MSWTGPSSDLVTFSLQPTSLSICSPSCGGHAETEGRNTELIHLVHEGKGGEVHEGKGGG